MPIASEKRTSHGTSKRGISSHKICVTSVVVEKLLLRGQKIL